MGLQFCIASYQAILAKYDSHSYAKLAQFRDFLPPDKQQDFQSLIDEGMLVTKVALQAAVNTADTISQIAGLCDGAPP